MPLTVSERITGIWPQTEPLLVAAAWAGVPYADAKTQAIIDTIDVLYATYAPDASVPGSVDSAATVVQQQVADMTVLSLMPLARDYYMQDILREGTEGGDVTLYDKLKALETLAATLVARIAERARLVAAAIRLEAVPVAAPVTVPSFFGLATGGRGRW